jgi:hypothetical protein
MRPGKLFNMCRDGDRTLQLLFLNEEFLVSMSHQLVLITSLPFVHTARRSYRLNGMVRIQDSEDPRLLSGNLDHAGIYSNPVV